MLFYAKLNKLFNNQLTTYAFHNSLHLDDMVRDFLLLTCLSASLPDHFGGISRVALETYSLIPQQRYLRSTEWSRARPPERRKSFGRAGPSGSVSFLPVLCALSPEQKPDIHPGYRLLSLNCPNPWQLNIAGAKLKNNRRARPNPASGGVP